MAWLYSCAIWIPLIFLTSHKSEARQIGQHPHRRARAAEGNIPVNNELKSRQQGPFVPQIPKDCEEIGICDHVPNYPTEYVGKLLKQNPEIISNFNVDVLEPDDARRKRTAKATMKINGKGQTSSHQGSFVPEIPKDCEQIGICDHVPNYPRVHVNQLIKKAPENFTKLNVDVLGESFPQRKESQENVKKINKKPNKINLPTS
ncbi:unnamed protein product [Parnassius apollo]|uniref:(apollo) hypothetical protein n=1 Tax=Parnassius apollo TaxID=110799 RepID=A0A8S3XBT6_PARAO|nr:unnamed protein product [Parnassius apollo]